MLVFTAKVSKGKLLAIALIILVVIGLLIALTRESSMPEEPISTAIETNEARIAFLQSHGWDVEPTPIQTQQVRIPQELSDILQKYNTLQKSQGYDLSDYRGETVDRYVYSIRNYPNSDESFYATLLVYDGEVIGADVASGAQGGIMQGLAYPQS